MSKLKSLVLGLALAAMAGQAVAATPFMLARPGGSYDAWKADSDTCQKVASRARVEDLPPGNAVYMGPVAGDMSTVIGGTIAFAIIGMIETNRQRKLAQTLCMRNLGYAVLPLTPDEAAVYGQLNDDALDRWERAFLAQDLSARMTASLTPAVPRLPPYQDAALTFGGLKLDPASLTAATGSVVVKGDVLTGRATRWRTAVLAQPFATTAGFVHLAGAPGAVFYQADFRTQKEPLLRPDGATWCGPVTQSSAQSADAAAIYCFTGRDDGYDVYQPTGYAWFAGPYGDGFTLPHFTKPIVLTERPGDDLGPLDFAIRVTAVSEGHVDIEAYLRHNGQDVVIWDRRLKFDSTGVAALPLWANRLVLTRIDTDAVTAVLDNKGDGRDWREGD